MSFNLNNPFSEKRILGPGETDPKADVELARTLLGDEAAEEYAEALKGDARGETLSDGLTDEEKAIMQKHDRETKEWEEKKKWEHIPGERIELTIGGKTKEQLLAEMKVKGITVSGHTKDLIEKITFPETKEHITLVKLTVSDLGFPEGATTEEIYEKAKDLGLEVVPPETGMYLRLQHTTQPEGEYLFMGMDLITGPDGRPCVFLLGYRNGGLWLDDHFWAVPGLRWLPDRPFVFLLPDANK